MITLQSSKPGRIVFHFNKGHLSDPTIPMWTLKMHGDTYYVDHVTGTNLEFSTKETPDNPTTKGSIQFKGHLTIVEEGGKKYATITNSP